MATPSVILTTPPAQFAECAPPGRRTVAKTCRPLSILMVGSINFASLSPELALRKSGHAVWVAYQVDEALDFLQQARFDLILVDVASTPLVGMKIATLVRLNQFLWGLPTPIVGLTATPWDAGREACLEAGFDEMVAIHTDPLALANQMEAMVQPDDLEPLVDSEVIWQKTDNDVAFLRELVQIFGEEAQKARVAIADAMSEGDHESLRQATHKLKGMVANFTQSSVVQLLQEIENAATRRESYGLVALLGKLNTGLIRLSSELQQILQRAE